MQEYIGVSRPLAQVETTWTRIEASVGKQANAVQGEATIDTTVNDFDNIYPWSDIRTCSLNKDGSVKAYLGDATFSWNDDYIMVEVPEFWWKREQTNGTEYIYISRSEQDGYKKATKRYIGRYNAGGSSSAATSKSGATPWVNMTIDVARNTAKKIGTGWGIMDLETWSEIEMLYTVEYADYDCQAKIGKGRCGSNSSALNSGTLDSFGMKSGSLAPSDTTKGIIYRGLENIWGNIFQWLDGINYSNYQAWISRNQSDYSTGKVAEPYTKLSYKCASSSGYIKEVGFDENNPDIQLPLTTGGSDSTYVPDYAHCGYVVVYVGGYWDRTAGRCGLWYFNSDSAFNSGSNVGCRLLYIPESEVE